MNAVQLIRRAGASIRAAKLLQAAADHLRRRSNHTRLVAAIVLSTAMVAALDFGTSAALIGSILFTLPITLCAFQASKRLLWATAATASALTVAAEFWGFYRGGIAASWDGVTDRGLLVVSLLTLTAFIHLWLRGARLGMLDATEIRRQSDSLAAQNEQLEVLVAAASRDIAVRKASETHLAQMEARYRGLLEAAPDAMVVVNAEGEIVLLNLQAEKQFGYSRDELVGQPVKNIIPHGFAERLIADGARTAAEALAQQIGTGIELIGHRKDGSEFPIELMLSPLESAEGILVTAAIRDVTSRHADHEALRASEEWHRMAVEVTEMGTWIWDTEQDELSWSDNFRRMFGLPSDDVLNYESILQYTHPDDRPGLDRSVKTTLESGTPFDVEHRVIWPDSSVHWIASRGGLRRNTDGRAVTLQGTTLDITERKSAQEAIRQREAMQRASLELMRSNDDLQQFAYVAAHDLQEPLRMVSSYTQLLAERYRGRLDVDADQYIAFAVDGASRMQLLIGDLLAYCQVGTATKDFRETSVTDALEEALLNLQGAIHESGGTVTHDALPTLFVDRAQLIQLFQNVVGNAIKYRSAEPPRIHVSAMKNPAGEWVFSMRDNGLGVDPRYYEKIFVMFKRLHDRSEFSGTGIGLALCKKIAERHDGRMWVQSTSGKGSTFFLALPGEAAPYARSRSSSSAPITVALEN